MNYEVQRIDIRERMHSLRRCGCNRCYDEYRRLEDLQYRPGHRYYITSDYLDTLPRPVPYMMGMDMGKEEAPMNSTAPTVPAKPAPEIKNPAIKLLVDRLKVVQSSRDVNAKQVETYKTYVKTYGANVARDDKEAAALRKALKRLGHAA